MRANKLPVSLMDKLIQQLHDITQRMGEGLDSANSEELEHFVSERGRLLELLKEKRASSEPTVQQRELIRKIVEWDRRILERMELLKSGALEGLRKVKINRMQHQAYMPAYTLDGVYFDMKR